MSTLETGMTVTTGVHPANTGSAEPDTLAFGRAQRDRQRRVWESIIDNQFVEWGMNPGLLEDEGIDAPSPGVLRLAAGAAIEFRDALLPPPSRVVPTGDGGIAFEWQSDSIYERIEIDPEGTIELVTMEHGRVVFRQILRLT